MTLAPGDILTTGALRGRAARARRARGSRSRSTAWMTLATRVAEAEEGERMKRARVAYAGAIHDATPAEGAHGRCVSPTAASVDEEAVVWLPPFEVGTVIALGLNYADHAKELALRRRKDEPLVFLKDAGRPDRPSRADAAARPMPPSCTTNASWQS